MSFFLIISAGLYFAFISFIILGLFRHSELPINSISNLPFVSVVIAARNEEKNLPDLIQDLVKQEYPTDKIEVIIVNDRSNDSTLSILEEAEKNYSFIKQIKVGKKSEEMTPKKHALKLGIEAARGDVIISTDADCRVKSLWVSSMVYSVFQTDGISIGYSKVVGKEFFDHYQCIDFLGIIAVNAGAGGWNHFWSGTGQNLAYRKSYFEKINGFETVKDQLSGDDMYLVQSISKVQNGLINIDPNSFVTTLGVGTIYEFINQRVRWSSNSRNIIQSRPLFFVFLVSAFLTNITILFYAILGISGWGFVFLIKFIFEGLVIYLGGRLFETSIKPGVYIIWALIQPFYIPIIGCLGIFNKFKWKP
tara:strand:+ start:1319 stop:2407 length:1089 start_codon:yes stop_codon:yes gene_type:complete